MISWFSALVLAGLVLVIVVANVDRARGRGPERFLLVSLLSAIVLLVLALLRVYEVLP